MRVPLTHPCPIFIGTPLTQLYFEVPAFQTDVLGRIKLGRLGQPTDLTGTVVFLASDALGPAWCMDRAVVLRRRVTWGITLPNPGCPPGRSS